MKILLTWLLLMNVAVAQISGGPWGTHSSITTYSELQLFTPTRPATAAIPYNGFTWDAEQVDDPCIPDPTADPIVLLFDGMAAPLQTGPITIARATATQAAFASNPQTAWVMDGSNPVLGLGAGGQPDSTYLRVSSCLYNPDDSNKLYLYYTCNATVDQMCLATSTDTGHTWSRQGVVLNHTIDGCSDETWTSQGAVLRLNSSSWIMVYSYRTSGATLPGVRYAVSTNGTSWSTGSCTALLNISPLFLEQHQIMLLGGKCVLVYENGNNSTQWTINSASGSSCSSTLTNGAANPFMTYSGTATWDQYHVATPWLFNVNNKSYLWYQGAADHAQPYGTNHWSMGLAPVNIPTFRP